MTMGTPVYSWRAKKSAESYWRPICSQNFKYGPSSQNNKFTTRKCIWMHSEELAKKISTQYIVKKTNKKIV